MSSSQTIGNTDIAPKVDYNQHRSYTDPSKIDPSTGAAQIIPDSSVHDHFSGGTGGEDDGGFLDSVADAISNVVDNICVVQ